MTGCTAPGGNIEVKQAPAESLARYKIIAVDVTNRDGDFSPEDVGFLSNALVDDLRKSGRFEKVYDSTSSKEHDADLKLSVLIKFVLLYNVKHIESSVTLTDAASGKILAAADVNAYSESAFQGGQMENAIAQLNDKIVNFATQR